MKPSGAAQDLMAKLDPNLDADGVNALLRRAFPDAPPAGFPG